MKFLILNAFLIISLRSMQISAKNSYFSECHITEIAESETYYVPDGKCLTFMCGSFNQTKYFDDSPNLHCSHWTNQSIPKDDIVQMNFQDCSMSSIEERIFVFYKQLSNLNATYLELETLQTWFFDEAKLLTKLNVSHNNIAEVPKFLVVNAQKLKVVDLSNNIISRIDPSAFAGDSKVTKLILSHNKIASLNKQFLDFLPELKTLDLSHNAISRLEEDTFKNLTILEHLDLSNNPMEELSINLFNPIIRLQKLYLSNAKLSTIKPQTFCRQQHLEILDLSHNNLRILDASAFDGGIFLPKFDNLRYLSIGGNQLDELDGFSSDRFPVVKIFGIHENRFDCCYLKNLFRSIHQHQLDLTFDENGKHPNVTDSFGKKCYFNDDFVYDSNVTSQIDWIAVAIMAAMIILAAIFYSVVMKFRYNKGQMQIEAAENASIKCGRKSSLSNFYDIPKY